MSSKVKGPKSQIRDQGTLKETRTQRQSALPIPVRRVAQGRVKAGTSQWVPQNQNPTGTRGKGREWLDPDGLRPQGEASGGRGRGVTPGPPLRYLPRPRGRGGPPATGPSGDRTRRGPSAAPTCRTLPAASPAPPALRLRRPPLPGVVVSQATAAAKGPRGGRRAPEPQFPGSSGAPEARRHAPKEPSNWLFPLSRRGGTEPLLG